VGFKPRRNMNVTVKTTERSSVGDSRENDHDDRLNRVYFECSRREAIDIKYALEKLVKYYGDDGDLATNVGKLAEAFEECSRPGADRAVKQVVKDNKCPLCEVDLTPAIAMLGPDAVDWHLHIHRKADFASAVKDLFRLKLEGFPFTEEMLKDWGEEDQSQYDLHLKDCPFFSERVLYTLIGKSDARTVLGYVKALAKAAGLRSWEIEREVDSE